MNIIWHSFYFIYTFYSEYSLLLEKKDIIELEHHESGHGYHCIGINSPVTSQSVMASSPAFFQSKCIILFLHSRPSFQCYFLLQRRKVNFFGKRNENRATEVEKCTLVSSTKWCRKMIIVSFIVTETPVAFVEPTLHQYFILLQTKFLQVLTNV